eukprot:4533497-Ditylum_brightwellii.AAC.1
MMTFPSLRALIQKSASIFCSTKVPNNHFRTGSSWWMYSQDVAVAGWPVATSAKNTSIRQEQMMRLCQQVMGVNTASSGGAVLCRLVGSYVDMVMGTVFVKKTVLFLQQKDIFKLLGGRPGSRFNTELCFTVGIAEDRLICAYGGNLSDIKDGLSLILGPSGNDLLSVSE